MSWCWFALLDPETEIDRSAAGWASASASAHRGDGTPAGLLAAWPAGRKPVRHAVRMDARLASPTAPGGWVSLVLVDAARAPLFDDPAVSGALRRVLDGPPADAVTTFVRDSSHFAGALTLRRSDPWMLRDDPFARIHPAQTLEVDAGLLATVPPPPGPVTQRYAGQPWPAAGF